MASPRRPLPSAPQADWNKYWAAVDAARPQVQEVAAESVSAKATYASSPGAFSLDTYPSITSFSRNQNRLMNEALGLFHTNPWVAVAERTISSRFARVDWHLEDDEGNTVGEDDPDISPDELSVQQLLERPNPKTTRRQMWNLTSRHMGLAGNSFWYLDQRNINGAPLSIIYINPVRMTPRLNPNGELLGWILDGPDNAVSGRTTQPGVPMELNEIIHFTLDEADFGPWGVGIAEAAQTKVELDRLATHHEATVFASGGRLTGIVTPKPQANQEITDDQWKSLVREWRNVAQDPDAAKRLIVAKGAVDFIQTSSNNEQLQLKELSGQGRDDILNAWGVPLSQVGITLAGGGLGIGERSKNDEAILWQGCIEPRAEAFREKVQYELLDRFELGIQLVIDTPEFDDSTPLFDSAQKAASVPLTNDERREVLGLDPLDPEFYGNLGKAVYVLNTMTPIFDPTLPTPPSPAPDIGQVLEPLLNPPEAAAVVPVPVPTNGTAPVKALLLPEPLKTLRARLQPFWERKVRAVVKDYLAEQRAVISDNARERYGQLMKTKGRDAQSWWNASRWEKALRDRLEPLVAEYAQTVARRTTRTLSKPVKAGDDWMTSVLDKVQTKSGNRITGINDTTRQRVQDLISQGVEQGLGPAELGDLIEEDAIFDSARAELIARTETALVYNEAALGSYNEFGVEEVEAVDGDEDEECAARDGQTFSLDEAESIEDHPNGTLDWIPVVKAVIEPNPVLEFAGAVKALAERPSQPVTLHVDPPPPANINVEPTKVEVNVPERNVTINVPEQAPPQITVQPAEVKLPEIKAQLPQQVEVIKMPNRVHKILRDKQGKAEGSMEGDA